MKRNIKLEFILENNHCDALIENGVTDQIGIILIIKCMTDKQIDLLREITKNDNDKEIVEPIIGMVEIIQETCIEILESNGYSNVTI